MANDFVLITVMRGGNAHSFAKVDARFAEAVNRRCWHLHKKGYAYASTRGKRTRRRPNGVRICIYMHRLVWELHHGCVLTSDQTIDHINKNKIDNRIENLQECSGGDNTRLAHWRASGQCPLQEPEVRAPAPVKPGPGERWYNDGENSFIVNDPKLSDFEEAPF